MKYFTALAVLLLGLSTHAVADPGDGFGSLYFEGTVYRTFGVPSVLPMGGKDDIYAIMGGVEDQLAVSAVAPGHPGYHGGAWAVWIAMWNVDVEPYLLTSVEEVLDAYMAGDLSIVRNPDADFRCPVIPPRPNK